MAVTAEVVGQEPIELSVNFKPDEYSSAQKIARVAFDVAEVALIVSPLEPQIAIPAAIGLAITSAVVMNPPDIEVFTGHLTERHYRKAADSVLTYAHQTVDYCMQEKSRLPKDLRNSVSWLGKNALGLSRRVIYSTGNTIS